MILFASRTVKTLTLQTDEGDVPVEIVALPRRHFEKAANLAHRTAQVENISMLEEMGGKRIMDIVKAFATDAGDEEAIKKAKRQFDRENADPLKAFSVPTLLLFGVRTIRGEKPTEAELDDLSNEAAETIAREVLRITKPSLFVEVAAAMDEDEAEAKDEADRKNAPAPGTDS